MEARAWLILAPGILAGTGTGPAKELAMPGTPTPRPRLIGINHVAIEVGDIDAALEFYGQFFDFELRGRPSKEMAFIDLGDQFLALSAGRGQPPDTARHFGLVVDDREGLRAKLEAAGVTLTSAKRLDFLDPWGNQIEVVSYENIQFLKARPVLEKLGAGDLRKTEAAKAELREKGIEPPTEA
jgi:catechol 2,3-dioxygenase-like lactoylglutathione lyase family enzyme